MDLVSTYEAIYLPARDNYEDPSKKGFDTEEQAWDYTSKYYCIECKKLYDKNKDSACDAEWMVDKEE